MSIPPMGIPRKRRDAWIFDAALALSFGGYHLRTNRQGARRNRGFLEADSVSSPTKRWGFQRISAMNMATFPSCPSFPSRPPKIGLSRSGGKTPNAWFIVEKPTLTWNDLGMPHLWNPPVMTFTAGNCHGFRQGPRTRGAICWSLSLSSSRACCACGKRGTGLQT